LLAAIEKDCLKLPHLLWEDAMHLKIDREIFTSGTFLWFWVINYADHSWLIGELLISSLWELRYEARKSKATSTNTNDAVLVQWHSP